MLSFVKEIKDSMLNTKQQKQTHTAYRAPRLVFGASVIPRNTAGSVKSANGKIYLKNKG